MRTGGGEMQEMLTNQVAGLQQALEGGLQRTRAETGTYISQLDALLTGASGELKETFEKNASALTGTLAERTGDIQRALEGGTESMTRHPARTRGRHRDDDKDARPTEPADRRSAG